MKLDYLVDQTCMSDPENQTRNGQALRIAHADAVRVTPEAVLEHLAYEDPEAAPPGRFVEVHVV